MSPPPFLHTSREGKGRRIPSLMGKMISSLGKKWRKEGRKGTLISWHQLVPREGVFHVGVFHLVRRRGGPGVTALVKLSCLVRDHLSVDPLTGAAGPDNNFISVKAAANLARIVALRRLHSPSAPWISILSPPPPPPPSCFPFSFHPFRHASSPIPSPVPPLRMERWIIIANRDRDSRNIRLK